MPSSQSRGDRLRLSAFLSFILLLLLLPGCLREPQTDDAPQSNATGKIRRILKSGSLPLDLATGLQSPSGLVLGSSGNLYFSETAAGKLHWIAPNGGVSTVAIGLNRPYDLLFDSGAEPPLFEVLYFVEFDTPGGMVRKACLICSGAVFGDVDDLASGQAGPIALTQDADFIYYINRAGNQVMMVTKDTSPPIPPPTELAGSPDVVLPQDIVIVGSVIYFTDSEGVKCIDTAAPQARPTIVVASTEQPGPLEKDSTGQNLYFAEVAAGTSFGEIWKVSAACEAGLPTLLADNLNEPRGIALDKNDVYFTERGGGKISRVPKAGGNPLPPPTTIASDLNKPFRLIVDETAVYFIETESIF